MTQSNIYPKRTRGFSLIELMLVLAASAVIAMFAFEQIRSDAQKTQAQLAGKQINTIALAMDSYIALRYNVISQQLNATGGPSDPGPRTCSAGVCTIDLLTLVNEGMLPAGYNSATTLNAFGSLYQLALHVSGTAPNYVVNGMVSTVSPWLNDPLSPASANNQPRGDLLGLAMQTAGPDSGEVLTANTLNGLAGVWTETSTSYPGMFSSIGQLGERSGYAASVYSAYLPRNGSLPMTGSLDVGGNSIADANNVTATGTITTGGDVVATGTVTGDAGVTTGLKETIGSACSGTGTIAVDAAGTGNLLSCQSGVWGAPKSTSVSVPGTLCGSASYEPSYHISAPAGCHGFCPGSWSYPVYNLYSTCEGSYPYYSCPAGYTDTMTGQFPDALNNGTVYTYSCVKQ